jgi:hypothetical protein
MRNVITMLLLCWAATASAQTTTVVMPDGTMMICTTYGTLVECTKV